MDKEEATCNVRVPDNGDTYRCGSKVVRGGFCAEHLPGAIEYGQRRIEETLASLSAVVNRQAWLVEKPASELLFLAARQIEAKAHREAFVERRHLDPVAAEEALRRAEELLKQHEG